MKNQSNQVKERPIIFSGEMVKAILDGKKTMTRRAVKFSDFTINSITPLHIELVDGKYCLFNERNGWLVGYPKCKFGEIGDRLWVREKFNIFTFSEDMESAYPLKKLCTADEWEDEDAWGRIHKEIVYAESEKAKEFFKDDKFRSPLFMPRWASRILLEITDIRVERLNDISEADAVKEGMPPSHPSIDRISIQHGFNSFSQSCFAQLWDTLNEKKGYPWSSNPWVWVVEFKVLEGA